MKREQEARGGIASSHKKEQELKLKQTQLRV